MLRTARLMAGKDLRIEMRSKVGLAQIVPFAVLMLVLFAFALDTERVLQRATPGLYWVAVLLVLILSVQRSYALESADGSFDSLRMSGLEPAGIFLGKAAAMAIQLAVLQATLAVGVLVLYNPTGRVGGEPVFHWSVDAVVLFVTVVVAATTGLCATGTLYGALAAGSRVRDTLLPLLFLPVVAPVLIGATKATESVLGTGGASTSEGWPWVGLLAVYALLAIAAGLVAFQHLLEEA